MAWAASEVPDRPAGGVGAGGVTRQRRDANLEGAQSGYQAQHGLRGIPSPEGRQKINPLPNTGTVPGALPMRHEVHPRHQAAKTARTRRSPTSPGSET
jgi:hypothetical protein